MMDQRLADALEVCLQALETGIELEQCLSLYPEFESDLRPLLEAQILAKSIWAPDPPRIAVDKSRTQMLARARELRPQRAFFGLPRAAAAMLAVALVFIIGSGGILAASAAAIPGDALYPLKLRIEAISIDLALGQSLKKSLQSAYSERRIDEAQKLLTLEREEEIVFEGVITAIGLEGLLIDEIPVALTDETDILGSLKTGDGVEVTALVRDGVLFEALQVRLRFYRLNDVVVSIADDHWVVGDLRLKIDDLTEIEHGVQIGERVLVLVHLDDDEIAYAQSILRVTSDEPPVSASATPTTGPIATETPTPEAEEIRFFGVVQQMTPELWIVGDSIVLITSETEIDEGITIGDRVRVYALVFEGGDITALRIVLRVVMTEQPPDIDFTPQFTPFRTIEPTKTPGGDEVEKVEFSGILQAKVANRWFIGGETVFITEGTEISGEPEIGDLLHVEAVVGEFGRLNATRIEVVSD